MTRALPTFFQKRLGTVLPVFILFTASVLPMVASADQVSVSMAQVIPTGPNTCVPLQVTSFTPYVYDNELNSYDVTVQDSSYVALASSVGNTQVPFQFITRSTGPSGTVRMHVDVASTPVGKSLPITMTLLSAKGPGAHVCAAIVSLTIPGAIRSAPSSGSASQTPTYEPTYTSSNEPAPSVTPTYSPEPSTSTGSPESSPNGAVLSVIGNVKEALDKACAVPGGAGRLWSVLLAVYILIIAAAIIAQPTQPQSTAFSIFLGLVILIPPLLFFAIWRTSLLCEMGGKWVPLLALLVAIVGFVAGFRKHPKFTQFVGIFSLPEA